MATVDEIKAGLAHRRPRVCLGAARTALPEQVARWLVEVVVDTRLSVPDMFVLRFIDADGDILRQAGLAIGTEVEVSAGFPGRTAPRPLVVGEVTAIEGEFEGPTMISVVRGYSQEHRMQRARRTRTFANRKVSEVAGELAREAGLRIGRVDPGGPIHEHLAQLDQTDWDFLRGCADEIGFQMDMRDGRFCFTRQAAVAASTPVPLAFRDELVAFSPRITGAGLTPDVEVRVWDPVQVRTVATTATMTAAAVSVGAAAPAQVARQLGNARPPTSPASPAGGDFGPPPSPTALVVTDHPLPVPAGSDRALTELATGVTAHASSGYAQAEGEALGDARIVAGAVVEVTGVPGDFAGRWMVSAAQHVFGADGSYRTRFCAAGRADRSLLGLARGRQPGPRRYPGVVAGVVTNINDPLKLGRVKVTLPWLSPDHESDWAPVAQLGAGASGGSLFLPEPTDQVLVAFELGDPRRPYVVGCLTSKKTGYRLDTTARAATPPAVGAVKVVGQTGQVIRRGMVSPAGGHLVFHDEVPPGGGRPTAAEIVLGTADDALSLVLDHVGGAITLTCGPKTPGKVVIQCTGQNAVVEINAGPTGSMTIDGGRQLTLKGQLVELSAQGAVTVKGNPIKLN